MLTIDGSEGEGGGQILRSSLALSIITHTPFRIERIRAGRERPGLLRQHLTAVRAAAAISAAETEGAELHSRALTFRPNGIHAGEYRFAVGTAGSACLVLQTVLPPLLFAPARSRVRLEGGTHNSHAPPFDFLARSFLPLLARMGADVRLTLDRPGFHPAGGGVMHAQIEPCEKLSRLDLTEAGPVRARVARVLLSRLPEHVAEREVSVLRKMLGWRADECRIERVDTSPGPGNVVLLEVERGEVTEVVTSFGQRGLRAEEVAEGAARELRAYLDSGAPVGQHLADQLVLPLALAGGGVYRTVAPTLHTTTNVLAVRRFLEVPIAIDQDAGGAWVRVGVNALRMGY